MSKKYYRNYTITESDSEKQEILIAQLADFGFDGFEQNDESVVASAPVTAINEEEVQDFLTANNVNFGSEIIEEQNWNAQWEQSFQPIVVEKFCAVRAAFHQPVVGLQYDIIITPKMSFGTGHHATTFMMLQAMQQIDFLRKHVIDFGSGTSILAILAEKLGASTVQAIDYDDWCIENGRENIQANNCTHIELIQASGLAEAFPADVILANINKQVILTSLPLMKIKCKQNGILLISGILQADEFDILDVANQNGLKKQYMSERNGWLCICFGLI